MSETPDEHLDEHVVFFTTALGDPAAERYPSLRAAVGRVESLCNDDDVRDAKVFRLVPVPLNVRSYFRVELDESALPAAPAPARPDRVPAPRSDSADEPRADETPDARVLRERRPMREMRDEIAPAEAPQDAAADEPAAEAPEPGRSLGFFVH